MTSWTRPTAGASLRHAALAAAGVVVAAVLSAAPARASTVTLQPSSADAYLDEDRPGNRFGSSSTMSVQSRSGGRDRRAIVQFSLSAIPTGSSITSATLELFMTAAPSATRTYDVHRVTRSWVESQVTWDDRDNNSTWTTPGGDYDPTPAASSTTGTVSNVWVSWDVTAMVQAWYTGSAVNYGVLIKDGAEGSTTAYAATFASRENGTPANRPRLVVTYTPPDLQVTGMVVDGSVVTGDTVTVSMTVTNNGPVAVTNLAPSALTTSGTATKALASGPTPASVASLAPGGSATFTWTYTITGASGQTYAFTGSASADGGIATAPATTNTGRIGTLAVSVTPTSVTAAGTNVQVQFTVDNGLASGAVDRVTITDPNTSIFQFTDPAWGSNDTSGWNRSLRNGNQFRFSSPDAGQDIPAGGSRTFTVTFSLIGTPGADTSYGFSVAVRRSGGGTTTLTASVLVRVPSLQVQSLTVDSSTISGGTVRVVMTVRNTGSAALSNVTPAALTAGGSAAKTLTGGPTPASVPSLAADATTAFEWVYTITGSTGQTYSFTGHATADGGVTAPSATSNTGSIVTYGLAVAPASVTAGSTGVQIQFTVTNNLTSGTVDQVTVTNPNTSIFQSDATWGGADTSGWTRSQPAGNQYRFTSPGSAQDIQAGGGTATFTVTFTTIGTPAVDTTYTFSVAIRQRGNTTTTLTDRVTVTRYVLAVTSVSPASIAADGSSTSRIRVTLTRGGAAQASQVVTFATTAGTFGGASSTTATTDAAGEAFVDLTSSTSATDVTADVTVTFASSASASTSVTFTAVALSLAASPASVPADGVATSTLTITLTSGGSPLAGRTIGFSTTAGTLSGASAATDGTGRATVTLQAPASKTTATASVTASLGTVTRAQDVTFTGITVGDVADLTVTAGSGTVTASWAWPAGGGYRDGVLILRRAGATPGVPSDGLAVNAGDTLADGSQVVARTAAGSGSSVTETGLANGTRYVYRAVGYYAGTLYSAGVSVDVTPAAGGAGEPRWSLASTSVATSDLVWDGAGGLYWGTTLGFATASDAAGTRLSPPLVTAAAVRTPPTPTVIDVLPDLHYIVGTDGGTVYALNGATGATLWQAAALGDAIGGAAAVQFRADSDAAFQAAHPTDVVFVGTSNASATNNRVYALDALTGAVRWTFNGDGSVAVDRVTGYLWADGMQNRLWVTTRSNGGTQPSVWVLDTVDGSVQAAFTLGDVTTMGWSWDAAHVYVSTTAGDLLAIDTGTLSLAWSGPLALGSPLVGYALEHYEARGFLYLTTQDGTVRAARLDGGGLPPTVTWQTAVPGATVPSVVAGQGVLYVGAADGRVHKLRLSDGTDVGQVTVGDGSQAVTSIAVDAAGGLVWAATAGGRVFSLPLP